MIDLATFVAYHTIPLFTTFAADRHHFRGPMATVLITALRDLQQAEAIRFFPFTAVDNCNVADNEQPCPLSPVDKDSFLTHTTTALRSILAAPFWQFIAQLVHNEGFAAFVASYLAHRDRPYQHHLHPSPSSTSSSRLAELDKLVYLVHLRAVSVDVKGGGTGASRCEAVADLLNNAPAGVAAAATATTAAPTAPADSLLTQIATLLFIRASSGSASSSGGSSSTSSSGQRGAFLSYPALIDLCALLGRCITALAVIRAPRPHPQSTHTSPWPHPPPFYSGNTALAALLVGRAVALGAHCPGEPLKTQVAGTIEEMGRLAPLLVADVATRARNNRNAVSHTQPAPVKAGMKAVDLSLSKVRIDAPRTARAKRVLAHIQAHLSSRFCPYQRCALMRLDGPRPSYVQARQPNRLAFVSWFAVTRLCHGQTSCCSSNRSSG